MRTRPDGAVLTTRPASLPGESSRWSVALSETTVGEEEAEAAAAVVRSGWLTQGEQVAAFEREFAETLGHAHAVAVSNCTVALELSFQAAGVGPGDEVIVPALTFVAAANAVIRCGARPVFADVVSEHDLGIDPSDVERKLTARTRAICPVHFAGYAADVPALRKLCDPRSISVVEDCAHAPGARIGEQPCGSVGDVGTFSFFGNKNLTTGEGGMVTTASSSIAETVRSLRAHGMTSTTWDRHRGHAFSYDVVRTATNGRLDEIRAAIGRVQLRRLAQSNASREALVRQYRARLSGCAELIVPYASRADRSAYHLFVVVLPERVDRTWLMGRLRDAGIQTSVHYPLTTRFSAYREWKMPLPVSDGLADRLLTLPLHPLLTTGDVDRVCDELLTALKR